MVRGEYPELGEPAMAVGRGQPAKHRLGAEGRCDLPPGPGGHAVRRHAVDDARLDDEPAAALHDFGAAVTRDAQPALEDLELLSLRRVDVTERVAGLGVPRGLDDEPVGRGL